MSGRFRSSLNQVRLRFSLRRHFLCSIGDAGRLPVAPSLCTCCRHYPGAADGRTPRSKFTHPCQPSPIPLSGRPAHRPFRGLLGVYSRCGLHSRSHQMRDRYPGASDISSPPCLPRLLPAGAIAGWALHPLEKRRLVTAHVDSRPSPDRARTARLRRVEM